MILFALCLLSTVVEARAHRYGGGLTGDASWLIGAPIYWFTARHYLEKSSHFFAAVAVVAVLMIVSGPVGVAAGVIGIAAAYWIYWPFALPNKTDSALLGAVMLLNVFGTIAASIFLVEPVASMLPKW